MTLPFIDENALLVSYVGDFYYYILFVIPLWESFLFTIFS